MEKSRPRIRIGAGKFVDYFQKSRSSSGVYFNGVKHEKVLLRGLSSGT